MLRVSRSIGTVDQVPRTSEPPPVTGPRLDLLRSLGFGELQHDSHVPFLSHLIGTRRLLVEWGSRPALCDAGLFHSVYGTEYFEPARQADRDGVVAIVGAEAVRIAWLWCNIRRSTVDPVAETAALRDGETERLTAVEVADIATLWAADTVEQIARMTSEERAFSDGLQSVIDCASEPAQQAVAQLKELLPAPEA
jgi:hypothetical protein